MTLSAPQNLDQALKRLPLIAILRHLKLSQAAEVGRILVDSGFCCIETPLSDDHALSCISALRESCGDRALIGAGTVLNIGQAEAAAGAGAGFMVMPHTSPSLIREIGSMGLETVPGFSTVSEAFSAIDAGANALKLFPAEGVPPNVLVAMKAVLPPHMPVLPVGSIQVSNMAAYYKAGARGFGLGGSLFKPHFTLKEIKERAVQLVGAWRAFT